MTERCEQVGLAGAGVTEGDHVDRTIEKASVAQGGEGGPHLRRQPLQIEATEGLLARELRLVEQPGDASSTSLGCLDLGQGLQILRMAQTFGRRSLADGGVL